MWTSLPRFSWVLALVAVACHPSGPPEPTFDRLAAQELVRALSDDALGGRLPGSPGHAVAQRLIIERFEALGVAPFEGRYRHPFRYGGVGFGADVIPRREQKAGTNLMGWIEGRSDSDSILIITAHYDHVGSVGGEVYNGADDNASGVAGLLAIADHFSQHDPKHDVLLVAVDAEEEGLAGARALIDDPILPRDRIVMNLNLDMISRNDRPVLYASGTSHWPFLGPLVEEVALTAPVALERGFDSSRDEDDWTLQSDHAVFYRAGIPHLYLGVADHADYHGPDDVFEKIDLDWFGRSLTTVILLASALDQALPELAPPPSSAP